MCRLLDIRHSAAVFITVAALFNASCSGGTDRQSVPRRQAYPRIDLPAAQYSSHNLAGLQLDINDAATIGGSENNSDWVDIAYPGLGAAVNLTVSRASSADNLEEIVSNRLERFHLNIGGNDAMMTSLTSQNGFEAQLFTAAMVATPVQFIAVDPVTRRVVSGAAFVPELTVATADSLAPLVAMLERDVIRLLQSL